MKTYRLTMHDGGSIEMVEITADSVENALSQIEGECQLWVGKGDWGPTGGSVRVSWVLYDEEGDEVDDGLCEVVIEPLHNVLINRACCGHEYCGDDPDDHDWTSQGEGGCDQNPDVWSRGGTTIVVHAHCRRCGLMRREVRYGSQRNPGQADEIEYVMADDETIAAWREIGAMDD